MSKRRSVIKAPPAAAGRKGWKSWEVILAVVGTLASIAGLVVSVIPLLSSEEPAPQHETPSGGVHEREPGLQDVAPGEPKNVPLVLPPPEPRRMDTKTATGRELEAARRAAEERAFRIPLPRKLSPQPVSLTLADGDQEVLLAGRLSLAVEFGSVGAERYMTLHLNVEGHEPEHHAVLGSGERFEFELDGKRYAVVVQKVDWEAQTAKLRMDAVPDE